jgi:hypothetical protein
MWATLLNASSKISSSRIAASKEAAFAKTSMPPTPRLSSTS